jgi:hypothetical protein
MARRWLIGVGAFAAMVALPRHAGAQATGARVQGIVNRPAVVTPADSFPHARHVKLQCLTCHLDKSGAMLTFERPRGCRECHHRDPERADCVHCHVSATQPDSIRVSVVVAAAGRAGLERQVSFPHRTHTTRPCVGCHTTPLTLLPADSVTTCRGCHDDHHTVGRSCATCHRTVAILAPHRPPARPHIACDACHATSAIAALTPTRSLCLACHDAKVDHNPQRECTSCHFQADPEQYRVRLRRKAG